MKFHIFHNWSKWTKVAEGKIVNDRGYATGRYIEQERMCSVCGYIQRKRKTY